MDQHFRHQAKTLFSKAAEYADDKDRLRNFKLAANLQGVSPRQALGGMLAKHLVSVFDLINDKDPAPQHIWDEKLGDASNYLVLLKALVVEELAEQAARHPQTPVFEPSQEAPSAP